MENRTRNGPAPRRTAALLLGAAIAVAKGTVLRSWATALIAEVAVMGAALVTLVRFTWERAYVLVVGDWTFPLYRVVDMAAVGLIFAIWLTCVHTLATRIHHRHRHETERALHGSGPKGNEPETGDTT